MTIPVLYEDDDVLVINKPAGLLVHSDDSTVPTVARWVEENHPEITGVGETAGRPGIVHRLDRDTTGVLVIAKNHETYDALKSQFHDRTVSKEYRAIIHGYFPDDRRTGRIELPIGRSASDPRRRVASPRIAGKHRPAITEYETLEVFADYSYLALRPRTGRTHQLRVHLLAFGHPIVCDALYAPDRVCPPELGRQALHASLIRFIGRDGVPHTVRAPLPTDMEGFLDKLRSAC